MGQQLRARVKRRRRKAYLARRKAKTKLAPRPLAKSRSRKAAPTKAE